MTEETTEAVVGDAVAASLERPGQARRGLFRWKKKAKQEPPPLTHCEDCGAELHGSYCAKCGQVAVDYRRSFRHVIADVADSFLNWDSKFIQTIGLLVLRPGWLTNQFVAGRRTRYLHPLRLYLLVSIAFFLVVRLLPMNTPVIDNREMTAEKRANAEEAIKSLPNLPEGVRAEVQKALAQADAPSPSSAPANAPATGKARS